MELASSTWYENDDLWVDSYSFAFPEVSFEAARAQVPKIIALSGCKGGVILDLCCGPGRHAVPFAERAFAVTGVDRTVFLLDKARAYAKVAEVEVEWVRQDMRRFVRHEAFDLAISMCTSFGYFDNPADNAAVLSNIFASLKDGGAFVLDGVGKEVLARRFEPTSSHELPDGGLIVQRRKVIDDWSRMDNQWILVKDNNALSLRFRHWIYSARELGGMLETAGFSKIRMYGDLDGAPYSPSAERLVALARKGAS